MRPRLSPAQLASLRADVARPAYDPSRLTCGMVHFGVGAFHRAHQSAFTDAAIASAGGNWGVVGVSLRRPDAAAALNPQDGLYSITRLGAEGGDPSVQVVGAIRHVLTAPATPEAVLNAMAHPDIHVITLTVTEAAYALDASGALDLTNPDVAFDLEAPPRVAPRSVVGWLAAGLSRRRTYAGGALTIVSCDNLRDNGRKLHAAVADFLQRREPGRVDWLNGEVAFPNSMVDCITPATDAAFLQRTAEWLSCEDRAAVRRENFAQWVIEDHFAGPRPAWERVGVELVDDLTTHEALKLHVLNAAHSALAYFGLPRGRTFVREAMADKDLARIVDSMIVEEVAPALPKLPVTATWMRTRARFLNPEIDHRLSQIAQDGAVKLRERIHPLIVALARAGRPTSRLAAVVRAWLVGYGGAGPLHCALDDPRLFGEPFRREPSVRAAMLECGD